MDDDKKTNGAWGRYYFIEKGKKFLVKTIMEKRFKDRYS